MSPLSVLILKRRERGPIHFHREETSYSRSKYPLSMRFEE